MSVVAFIESNTSGTGRLFAAAARTLGFEPVMLAKDPSRYPYLAEDAVDYIRTDTSDQRRIMQVVADLHKSRGIVGITSSSEYWIGTAAGLAKRLGLPGPDMISVESCRNKAIQRRLLASAGLDKVRHRTVYSVEQAVARANTIGYPVVLKPVSASGSLGVCYCAEAEAVAAHARLLLSEANLGAQGFLIEQAINGPEYSVEIFNGQAVGICAKHTGELPYFVEIGHEFPARLSQSEQMAMMNFAQSCVAALGLGWGPVHVELRKDGAEFHIMEVNPRLAGGFIPELVRQATGIDLVLETVRQATGASPQLQASQSRAAAIRFLTPPHDGILQTIIGRSTAENLPDIVEVRCYHPFGTKVYLHRDFRDRIGHVIAASNTVDEAVQAAEAAFDMLIPLIGIIPQKTAAHA